MLKTAVGILLFGAVFVSGRSELVLGKELHARRFAAGLRRQSAVILLMVLGLAPMLLTACQGEAAETLAVAVAATTVPPATPTITLPAPVVAVQLSPTALPEMVSFQPINPTEQLLTAEAGAAAIVSPTPELITVATGEPTATSSPTPQPTFTPPTLPETSPNEHYWLIRPVPQGGTVWTDKAYPFGSTRGGSLRPHHGVEFNVPSGTQILAAASGTVVVAGADDVELVGPQSNFYGQVVVIQHDFLYLNQPVYTLYGHLSELFVNVGQTVAAGDIIALSGATGVADGSHLHFEVRVGENSYNASRNPLLWLWPFPDRGTVTGRVVFPDGGLAYEAPVSLRRIDGPAPYLATTTYAVGEFRSDQGWGENFAIDDVPAGYYEITVRSSTTSYTVEAWVFSRQTTFVEIRLENDPE